MSEVEADRGTRWPFFVAGLAALAITIIRATAGGTADLPYMLEGLTRPEFGSVTIVNWHVLTATFAILTLALFAATGAERAAARAIGLIATGIFAAGCIAFLVVNAQMLGSPFANWPWLPLGLEALLCGFAVWRA